MKRRRAHELLSASWQGELPQSEAEELRDLLAADPELRRMDGVWEALGELERSGDMEVPSERMRQRLSGALDAVRMFDTRRRAPAGPRARWWTAAAGLVGAGLAGGLLAGWLGARADVQELRSQIGDLRSDVVVSLLEHQAASERLRAVAWSERGRLEGEVLDALLLAVRRDPSVNVRLAAVDALSGHLDRASRERLAATLPEQASPLVQLRLVEALFAEGPSGLDVEPLLEPGVLDETVRRRLAELTGRAA